MKWINWIWLALIVLWKSASIVSNLSAGDSYALGSLVGTLLSLCPSGFMLAFLYAPNNKSKYYKALNFNRLALALILTMSVLFLVSNFKNNASLGSFLLSALCLASAVFPAINLSYLSKHRVENNSAEVSPVI